MIKLLNHNLTDVRKHYKTEKLKNQKNISMHETFSESMVNLNKLLADLLMSSIKGDIGVKSQAAKQLNFYVKKLKQLEKIEKDGRSHSETSSKYNKNENSKSQMSTDKIS